MLKTKTRKYLTGRGRAGGPRVCAGHGWVAKQQIDVNIDQQISITGALEKAQSRVIEGLYTDVTPPAQLEDNTHHAAADIFSPRRDGVDGEAVVANAEG
jgi:hypothetical protein